MKTQDPSEQDLYFEALAVLSIYNFVDSDEYEMILCNTSTEQSSVSWAVRISSFLLGFRTVSARI